MLSNCTAQESFRKCEAIEEIRMERGRKEGKKKWINLFHSDLLSAYDVPGPEIQWIAQITHMEGACVCMCVSTHMCMKSEQLVMSASESWGQTSRCSLDFSFLNWTFHNPDERREGICFNVRLSEWGMVWEDSSNSFWKQVIFCKWGLVGIWYLDDIISLIESVILTREFCKTPKQRHLLLFLFFSPANNLVVKNRND